MRFFFWILACASVIYACKPAKKEQPEVGLTRLITSLEAVRLRDAPGEDAKVLLQLPKGTVLYDLGEVSNFTTKIKLHGVEFDEPWLKVRTAKGVAGWVYAGELDFARSDPSEQWNLLIEKRLIALFGQATAEQIKTYRRHFQEANSAVELAEVYRAGTALRDSLTGLMQDKIAVTDPNELPDLFWLEQAIPGFAPQLVAEGTAYYLFWNYKTLWQKAKTTNDLADDHFIQLAFTIFPEDSVEYFYPAWFIQTWDYGGSSLLGRGIHDRVLQKLDETAPISLPFAPEIRHWKAWLVNDMTQADVTYWEKLEKIVAELDTILVRNYSILSDADKIGLQTRRKQLDDPGANGISVNQQSGS